jgi:hypothetical protein
LLFVHLFYQQRVDYLLNNNLIFFGQEFVTRHDFRVRRHKGKSRNKIHFPLAGAKPFRADRELAGHSVKKAVAGRFFCAVQDKGHIGQGETYPLRKITPFNIQIGKQETQSPCQRLFHHPHYKKKTLPGQLTVFRIITGYFNFPQGLQKYF